MTRTAPGHPATARGLITDHAGRWLIVLPAHNHRWWHLPGGLIEHNESPTAACRREIREELGIDLPTGPLVAVDWTLSRRIGRRARFTFTFSMGTQDATTIGPSIRLQSTELSDWQWCPPVRALSLLHPDVAARVRHLLVCAPGFVAYTEGR